MNQPHDLAEYRRARKELSAKHDAAPLETGGGGGHPPDMEPRVAVLEQIAKSTEASLREIKDELRATRSDLGQKFDALRTDVEKKSSDHRDRQERDFRLVFGALIAVALTLAGIMAKGFRWL